MDQKTIDALIKGGFIDKGVDESSQEEKTLREIANELSPAEPHVKGRVMGQISTVTEESEKGTNVVMGFLENVLTTIGEQRTFLDNIIEKQREGVQGLDWGMICNHIKDISTLIEEEIYAAMDAFQFQDIGRQKLMKVMYTLGRLNEYLNELLGHETQKDRTFGKNIDQKTLEQDKDKTEVDAVIAAFQSREP